SKSTEVQFRTIHGVALYWIASFAGVTGARSGEGARTDGYGAPAKNVRGSHSLACIAAIRTRDGACVPSAPSGMHASATPSRTVRANPGTRVSCQFHLVGGPA